MFNNKIFGERIRLLRESHHLSLNQLAEILGKKKAAIADVETARMGTTLETCTEISNFFAVSLDWLTGRSNEPYSLEIIQKLEDEIMELEHNIGISNNTNLIYLKAVIYCCRTKLSYYPQREHYSIDRRADVLYCLHFWKYAANKLEEDGYHSQETSYQEALKQIMEIDDDTKHELRDILKAYLIKTPIDIFSGTKSSKRAGSSFATLCYECIDVLDGVITASYSKQPYYDIRKPSSD